MSAGKYNVLIVDDDLLILDELKEIMDWEKEGYNLVGLAENGIQAIAVLQEQPVDFLIVDIEMPLMNGLEFIHYCRKNYPHIQVLLLTAFSSFDYAREALSLGVNEYILKHELTREIILDALNKMASRYGKEQQDERILRIQKILNENEDLLLKNNLGMENVYLAVIDYPLSILEKLKNREFRPDFSKVSEAVQNGFTYQLNATEILIVFQSDPLLLKKNVVQIEENLHTTDHYKIAVSRLCQTTHEFREEVRKLSSFCRESLFYVEDRKTVYDCDEVITGNEVDTLDLMTKLTLADSQEMVCQMAESLMEKMENERPDFQLMLPCVNVSCRSIRKCLHSSNQISAENEFFQWQKCRSYPELKSCFDKAIAVLRENRYSSKVKKIIAYFKDHMEQENVIEDISVIMDNNKEYLSKLCKKETGYTLVQLLNEIRLKQAMYDLTYGDYKVYEVAKKCGFNSSQYFSIVFYKRFNKSPSEVIKEHEDI